MQREQISRTSSSSDESLSRVLIHSVEQTSEHTLPLSIIPSASSLITTTTTTRRTTHTQTLQEIQSSKSNPSFAETQLLSVYYPSLNPKNQSINDKCIFVEQQDRQPIRYRTTYDPLSLTKSTQTSTLLVDENQQINSKSNQDLNEKPTRTPSSSSSSSSSVTTVIAQNEELDSDHTSQLTFDDITTQSSTSSSTLINQEKEIIDDNQRISSWPPVPDDILLIDNQYENDEQTRPLRVQFAEQLVHVIPASTTNSLTEEEPISPPAIIPRTNTNTVDSHPINQSKWMKTHMDSSDIQINTTSSRVNAIRSLFEQQTTRSSDSSTINTSIRRIEPEEKPSKHGVEIRFRVNDPDTSTIHHAEPAKILPYTEKPSVIIPQDKQPTSSFSLDQIRQITGRQLKNLSDIGHYLSDGHTWQWNEIFWLSLTTSQRDQLKDLEHHQSYSRENSLDQNDFESSSSSSASSNEKKRFKSTIHITGAGAWQQHKSRNSTSGITKYSESNTIDETQASISVFGSAPNPTYSRVGSEESLASSNKRSDSQITIIESGYSSADDQQRFRPNSSTIIEESTLHPIDSNTNSLNYEEFISDYLSTYAKHLRSNDGRVILSIDEQEIYTSNDNLILTKKNYLNNINQEFLPFETELDQLVIFLYDEPIILSSDRWLFYRKKYNKAKWIHKLHRINRNIPLQLIPIIEQWLSDHAILLVDTHELNVDGLTIPLIGRLGLHILDLHQNRQLQPNYWNEILTYLIQIGYVSYDSNENLVRIAHSELDIRRPLKSPSVERLTEYLRLLNHIHFHEKNGTLIITEDFLIPNEYIHHLFLKYQQGEGLDISELANILSQICEINEEENTQSLILSFNNQILRLNNSNENHIHMLIQWLEQLNQQKLINITKENNIIIYPNNQDQEIFINHKHVDAYMKTKQNSIQTEIINMNDIAHILLLYNYVQYSSGQLVCGTEPIILDTNEFLWLQSIIHSIRSNDQTQQTEIELFDGQHTERLEISYEHMPPTDNSRTVANHLFQNGNVRYIVNTGDYAYHYVSPKEKHHSKEYELLSSHIQHLHIDEINQYIELEFSHDPNHFLRLPSNWYQDLLKHQFDRSYIIDMLLDNGGIVNEDSFIFNNQSYSLKFSSKQKQTLIDYYVEFINNQGGIIFDKTKNLLLLENPSDNSQLYLTYEHTEFIHKNQYRRQDMKYLLEKSSEIKQDEFNNWLLYYNNQYIQLPSIDQTNEQVHIQHSQSNQTEILNQYHRTIDYMYHHNLITSNQHLNILQIHFSNQILTIPLNQLQSIMIKTNNILPFTSEQLSQWLLKNSDEINLSPHGYIQLTYKTKLYQLPIIDPKLKLLFPFNKSLRLIQKTSSTTTLDIQQPNESNNYTIDPLLILANYIYRAGRIYQDEFGRLVIKLHQDEIVIPHSQARNSVDAINTSPNRTGTIIARLINQIGKVQSNQTGGIIITIGKNSLELSKEIIDQSKNSLHLSNENLTSPILQHSKSANSLSSSSIGQSRFIDDTKSLYLKPRLLIIHDEETIDITRFYIQYTSEQNKNSNPIRSTQPQLITPHYYQNIALRDASVHVYGQNEIYYENLAQYLSTKQSDLSSYIVRRMLNFSSRDEYFVYLNNQMSAINAEQLVQESEEPLRYINIGTKTSDDEIESTSPDAYYNVQNGTLITESIIYDKSQQDTKSKFIDRSPSSSSLSRSPQTANGQSLTTPDKNITLPRSTTLSGQSNDGESEGRTTVSRSVSAAAKVATSKSDTIKSNTSSSAASSREYSIIPSSATVVRAQSLVSPNRTGGSKSGGGDEVKKEKKSKFRTPSFLRKRKEKKEAAHKDKVEK